MARDGPRGTRGAGARPKLLSENSKGDAGWTKSWATWLPVFERHIGRFRSRMLDAGTRNVACDRNLSICTDRVGSLHLFSLRTVKHDVRSVRSLARFSFLSFLFHRVRIFYSFIHLSGTNYVVAPDTHRQRGTTEPDGTRIGGYVSNARPCTRIWKIPFGTTQSPWPHAAPYQGRTHYRRRVPHPFLSVPRNPCMPRFRLLHYVVQRIHDSSRLISQLRNP